MAVWSRCEPAAELTDAEIVRLMVGRELTDVFQRRPAGTDREVLRVEDLRSNWHRGVSFSYQRRRGRRLCRAWSARAAPSWPR